MLWKAAFDITKIRRVTKKKKYKATYYLGHFHEILTSVFNLTRQLWGLGFPSFNCVGVLKSFRETVSYDWLTEESRFGHTGKALVLTSRTIIVRARTRIALVLCLASFDVLPSVYGFFNPSLICLDFINFLFKLLSIYYF